MCIRDRLIQLLNEWSPTDELYVQDNADMHFLRRRGVLQAEDFTGNSIVMTIPQMRGKTLTITKPGADATAKFQSYVHQGAAIPTAAYHKVRCRQTSMLQLLVLRDTKRAAGPEAEHDIDSSPRLRELRCSGH